MLCDELRGYANPLAKISRMMRSGELTPLIKGLYETDAAVPGHYLAGIIYGPSYLSFEFALAWHGLIPEAVYSYTSATCGKGRKKRYDTAFGTFLFRDIPVLGLQARVYASGTGEEVRRPVRVRRFLL